MLSSGPANSKTLTPQFAARFLCGSGALRLGLGFAMKTRPIFSPEDQDLAQINWGFDSDGYAIKRLGGPKLPAHRIVLERKIGRPLVDGEETDHWNRKKLDNRRENLRVVTRGMNNQNRASSRPGIPRGAYFNKYKKKWHAGVKFNGRQIHLGYFATAEEAGCRRSFEAN